MADRKDKLPINEEAQAELNRICDKEDHELTQDDIDFLWARRDYLGSRSKDKFREVLAEKEAEVKARVAEDAKNAGKPSKTKKEKFNGQPDPTKNTDDEDEDEDDDGEDEEQG